MSAREGLGGQANDTDQGEQVRATNTNERLSRREGRLAWCTNKGGGRADANERPSD